MARTTLTPDQLAVNSGVAPTANAADSVNGNQLKAEPKTRKLTFRIACGSGSPANVTATFRAGSDFPAQKRGQGDLAVVVPQSAARYVVLDSMRFVNPDGFIYVDWSSSTSVTIEAVRDDDKHA